MWEGDASDHRPSGRRLSLHPIRLPVFRRRRGAARPSHRAGGIRPAAAARRRLRLDRAFPDRTSRAARRLLRLRAAIAGAVHRRRLHRIQSSLHRDADALGRHAECRGQSGGAQQRHPADKQAGRTQLPCVLLRASARRRVRLVRDRRQRRGRRRPRAVSRAYRALRRDQPGRDARQGAVRARAYRGAHGARSARPGPIPRRRRSTRCTTCIPIWPTKSCAAAPPGTGCCGTSPARPSKAWSSRWTAARFRWSTIFGCSSRHPLPDPLPAKRGRVGEGVPHTVFRKSASLVAAVSLSVLSSAASSAASRSIAAS